MRTMEELLGHVPQVGRLEWIGISPAARGEIEEMREALVEVGTGILGDHHARSGKGHRQVTLIQKEHLPAVASLCGRDVSPAQLRRNLVVSGLNLASVKDRRFRVGEVLLEGTGDCHPCSRMEETLGPGGFQAARGHGGITARVLEPGTIRVGDAVEAVQSAGTTGAQ